MQDSEINLLEYVYEPGQMVEIPGKLMEGLMQFLRTVHQSETKTGFISAYPKSTKEVFSKTDKKHLEKVDVKWEIYPTAEAYFNQAPQEITTMLGAGAQDLLMLIQQGHLDNIKAGVAKKLGDFKEEPAVDLKLV